MQLVVVFISAQSVFGLDANTGNFNLTLIYKKHQQQQKTKKGNNNKNNIDKVKIKLTNMTLSNKMEDKEFWTRINQLLNQYFKVIDNWKTDSSIYSLIQSIHLVGHICTVGSKMHDNRTLPFS